MREEVALFYITINGHYIARNKMPRPETLYCQKQHAQASLDNPSRSIGTELFHFGVIAKLPDPPVCFQ